MQLRTLLTLPFTYTKLPSTALKSRYLVTSVWTSTRTSLPFPMMNLGTMSTL